VVARSWVTIKKGSRGYHAKTIGTTVRCVKPHPFAVASTDSGWYPPAWLNNGSGSPSCKKQEVHQKTTENPPNPRSHNSSLPLFEKLGTLTPKSVCSVGVTRFGHQRRAPTVKVQDRPGRPSPFRGCCWTLSGRPAGAQTARNEHPDEQRADDPPQPDSTHSKPFLKDNFGTAP
jgi:hypothetical protein